MTRADILFALNRPALTDEDCVGHAILALRLAREYLKEAGASTRCVRRVRAALSSALGCYRNTVAKRYRGDADAHALERR